MRVHQVLHGYRDGHRLLAASIDLSRNDKYAMLTLSDMSGRSMVPGFERYLTAYRLAESGHYAFAQTWYAPEMDRPGCVWTHTLLLDPGAVEQLESAANLRELFRRPDGRQIWTDYEQELEFTARPSTRSLLPPFRHLAVSVLFNLYVSPREDSIFIAAPDARLYEELALAVWDQQWPALRLNFSFCTGSISNRTANGHPMDLQIVPDEAAREVRREVKTGVFAEDMPAPAIANAEDEWLALALNDLAGSGATAFRDFLRRTPKTLCARQIFKPLAQLYLATEAKPVSLVSPEDIVLVVGDKYPLSYMAIELKRLVAGPKPTLTEAFCAVVNDADILIALATSGVDSAFDASNLEINSRVERLWRDEPHEAQRLLSRLIRSDHGPLGETILSTLFSTVTLDEALRLSEEMPGLLATFLHWSPQLARDSRLWSLPRNVQREIFDAATKDADIPSELARDIVTAMLDAGSDAAAEQTARRFGEEVVLAMLAWFDARGCASQQLMRAWGQTLRRYPLTAIRWLKGASRPTQSTVVLVADTLDPRSPEVRDLGVALWVQPTNPDRCLATSEELVGLHTFFVALSLNNPSSDAYRLVVEGFTTVHEALATNAMEYRFWSFLDEELPRLSWGRNWDKCERLRRGIVEAFIQCRWPQMEIFRCAQRTYILELLLQSCREVRDGKDFLKSLKRLPPECLSELTPEQRRILKDA